MVSERGYVQLIAGVLANFVEGWGSATTTLVRRSAVAMKDFILYSWKAEKWEIRSAVCKNRKNEKELQVKTVLRY
jgi:hypothetical protein